MKTIYLVFSSLEMQTKDSYRPKYTANLLTLSEKTRLTNLKKQQLQKCLSQVCIEPLQCLHFPRYGTPAHITDRQKRQLTKLDESTYWRFLLVLIPK